MTFLFLFDSIWINVYEEKSGLGFFYCGFFIIGFTKDSRQMGLEWIWKDVSGLYSSCLVLGYNFFTRSPCKLWAGAWWTSQGEPDLARTSSSARHSSHSTEWPQQFLTFSSPPSTFSSLNWPVLGSWGREGIDRKAESWQQKLESRSRNGRRTWSP